MSKLADNIRMTTKLLIGAVLTFATLMQIDAVKNYVTPLIAVHPKLASIVAALAGIGMLLHNPEVQKVLGIDDAPEVKPEDKPEVK